MVLPAQSMAAGNVPACCTHARKRAANIEINDQNLNLSLDERRNVTVVICGFLIRFQFINRTIKKTLGFPCSYSGVPGSG